MIQSLFIANRGEIALRIIRACKELGIESVIAYSEADENSYPVQFADKKVCIGKAAAAESYLNSNNIISAAIGNSCNAIHPGVGFLSENAAFAREVQRAGMIFVGPEPDTIALVGDKVSAKAAARKARVPCIPGTEGAVQSSAEILDFANEHGFPVILKAASGGGGKGMRVVRDASEIEKSFAIATTEAEKAFSDKRIYVEKFIAQPRHVEAQLIADAFSNVAHLGERDCSVQKDHQKLIEESPSSVISESLRKKICMSAVALFRSINYKNAGTVEFLVEGENFYFMEVNARIQVEHPVSELVSGLDLIKEQILIASGEALSVAQDQIVLQGYAMECRINALAPGPIDRLDLPGGNGVRVDTWLRQGTVVPPFYDALLIKLLVHASNRAEGIEKMLRALKELNVEGAGFASNRDWFLKILQDRVFRSGKYSINYLEETGILNNDANL